MFSLSAISAQNHDRLAHVLAVKLRTTRATGLTVHGEWLLMKRIIRFVTFLALSVAVSHVHAQAVGDPRKGLALAQQVCSECHAIRRGRSPNSQAPTFLELANAPGMTT